MTGPLEEECTEKLFVYGCLRRAEVQRAVFGRDVTGIEATLFGWKADRVTVRSPDIAAIAGAQSEDALTLGTARDRVEGVLLTLTPSEIEAADNFEAGETRRMKAFLGGGSYAWVYVANEG